MRGAWKIGFIVGLLLVSACGKNVPVYQAPTPWMGNPGGTGFQPQLPQGYPNQYTPFLPVDYYMRNHPQMAAQWPVLWTQWQAYAVVIGVSPYNFPVFWFEFCPQQWNAGAFYSMYSYLDQNFYYWVTPTTAFSPAMSAQTFWTPYQGFGYGSSWTLTFY